MSEYFVPTSAAGLFLIIAMWRAYLYWEARPRELALKQYQSLFHNNTDAVVKLDRDGSVHSANSAFAQLTGWEQEAISGAVFVDYVVPEDRPAVLKALKAAWKGQPQTHETAIQDRDGRLIEVKLTTVPIFRLGKGVVGVYQIAQDIRLRKEMERKLETQALHDYLTGLPNRALFEDRLEHAIERGRRPGTSIALLYIDLDRFKAVNDDAGHSAGDELLKVVAGRLGCIIRGGDTVARLGGDEFGVLLENIDGVDAALKVASRITDLLGQPVPLTGGEVQIGASIGVAVSTPDMNSLDQLVRQSDTAMYAAKRLGGCRYELYRPEFDHSDSAVPLGLEADLRRAIAEDELVTYYQPIIDLDSTWIVGVEALVRWNHPEFGLLPPARFIPLAEETGLIEQLDHWVLCAACRDVVQLDGLGTNGATPIYLSVNHSKLHLESEDSIEAISEILEAENFDPRRLQLEITETVAGSDRQRLRDLKDLGIRLAIDDFGKGFSSLGYLKDVKVDVLKVDRSFVRALGKDQTSTAIVRTILTLAHVLGLEVIIEGIENAGQLEQLRNLGGRFVQGFYFAEPMDLEALKSFVDGGLPPEWNSRSPGSRSVREEIVAAGG